MITTNTRLAIRCDFPAARQKREVKVVDSSIGTMGRIRHLALIMRAWKPRYQQPEVLEITVETISVLRWWLRQEVTERNHVATNASILRYEEHRGEEAGAISKTCCLTQAGKQYILYNLLVLYKAHLGTEGHRNRTSRTSDIWEMKVNGEFLL